jgi:hypothetical protein
MSKNPLAVAYSNNSAANIESKGKKLEIKEKWTLLKYAERSKDREQQLIEQEAADNRARTHL